MSKKKRVPKHSQVELWQARGKSSQIEVDERIRYQQKRKVARRHFAALDIDYRTVTNRTGDWWAPGPDQLPLDNNGHEAGATATSGVAP